MRVDSAFFLLSMEETVRVETSDCYMILPGLGLCESLAGVVYLSSTLQAWSEVGERERLHAHDHQ